MNKKLIIATIVAISGIFAFDASAQGNKDCRTVCPDNTPCAQAACAPTNCTETKCPTQCSPFAGLNLTADQQTKLSALRAKCADQRKACKDKQKADRAKDKADRMSARKENRASMLASIKEILTPEQYVKFLENSFVDGRRDFAKDMKRKFKGDNDSKDRRMSFTKDARKENRK